MDLTTDQAINKGTKTTGCIIGFSLNKSAMQKWILTAHDRTSFAQRCRSMASLDDMEASMLRVKADEECVDLLVIYLIEQANPFQSSTDLANLTYGVVASKDITEDLPAETKGSC